MIRRSRISLGHIQVSRVGLGSNVVVVVVVVVVVHLK